MSLRSSSDHFPVFIRWLNAWGLLPTRRANSASLIPKYASAIFIFFVMFILSPPFLFNINETLYKVKKNFEEIKENMKESIDNIKEIVYNIDTR